VRGQVAVSADKSRLFVARRDHRRLGVRTHDGKILWELPLGDELWATPTLASDGSIFVGSYDGTVHAISSDGVRLWRYVTGGSIVSSVTVAEGKEKTLYVGSADGKLYALSMDGKLRWATATGSPIGASSPALTADGMVLVGNQAGNLVAIRRH
jgi:outer membrane protein assembly factor BamB